MEWVACVAGRKPPPGKLGKEEEQAGRKKVGSPRERKGRSRGREIYLAAAAVVAAADGGKENRSLAAVLRSIVGIGGIAVPRGKRIGRVVAAAESAPAAASAVGKNDAPTQNTGTAAAAGDDDDDEAKFALAVAAWAGCCRCVVGKAASLPPSLLLHLHLHHPFAPPFPVAPEAAS